MPSSRSLSRAVLCVISLVLSGSPSSGQQQGTPSTPRDFWNQEYLAGKALLHTEPSPLLMEAIKNRKPGTALDVGMGEGRNAVYLAEKGWTVTGVDLSDVAIAKAEEKAAARAVSLPISIPSIWERHSGT